MAGRAHARAVEPLLARRWTTRRERGVRACPVIKIARRISQAIVETAREEECNFLVIGQPAGAHSSSASCLGRGARAPGRPVPGRRWCTGGSIARRVPVVVPVTKGRNSQLAAELAPAFRQDRVPARAVPVAGLTSSKADAEQLVARQRDAGGGGVRAALQDLRGSSSCGALSLPSAGGSSWSSARRARGRSRLSSANGAGAIARYDRHPVDRGARRGEQRAPRFERFFFREGSAMQANRRRPWPSSRPVSDYLPTFAAGLLVLALGVLLAWLAKRVGRAGPGLAPAGPARRAGWAGAPRSARATCARRCTTWSATWSWCCGAVFLDNALQLWGLEVLSG